MYLMSLVFVSRTLIYCSAKDAGILISIFIGVVGGLASDPEGYGFLVLVPFSKSVESSR